MGLSRNKVAVSEGAAGSPPFYGERSQREISRDNRQRNRNSPSHKGLNKEIRVRVKLCKSIVVRFSGSDDPEKLKEATGV